MFFVSFHTPKKTHAMPWRRDRDTLSWHRHTAEDKLWRGHARSQPALPVHTMPMRGYSAVYDKPNFALFLSYMHIINGLLFHSSQLRLAMRWRKKKKKLVFFLCTPRAGALQRGLGKKKYTKINKEICEHNEAGLTSTVQRKDVSRLTLGVTPSTRLHVKPCMLILLHSLYVHRVHTTMGQHCLHIVRSECI